MRCKHGFYVRQCKECTDFKDREPLPVRPESAGWAEIRLRALAARQECGQTPQVLSARLTKEQN
jgi:hypothetical protein